MVNFFFRKLLSKKKFPLKRINSQYLVNLFLECPVLYRNRVFKIFLYFLYFLYKLFMSTKIAVMILRWIIIDIFICDIKFGLSFYQIQFFGERLKTKSYKYVYLFEIPYFLTYPWTVTI